MERIETSSVGADLAGPGSQFYQIGAILPEKPPQVSRTFAHNGLGRNIGLGTNRLCRETSESRSFSPGRSLRKVIEQKVLCGPTTNAGVSQGIDEGLVGCN